MPSQISHVLERIRDGDEEAKNELFQTLYHDLHQIASGLMAHERPDHILQPTALVHEAFIRLCDAEALHQIPNRRVLFGALAKTMRDILVDHARQRAAAKRGGKQRRVPLLDDCLRHLEEQNLDMLAVHEALERLAERDERQSHVATLRFLLGFTVAEVAQQLEVSVSTVESDGRIARAWLYQQLRQDEP